MTTNWSLFDAEKRVDHTKALAFFDPDGGTTIQRFDVVKYKAFDKLTTTALSFFWIPEEIFLGKDVADFKALTPNEKHIFTSNIRRQIVLDSLNQSGPILAFSPVVGLPELDTWITTWAFSETIHSRSYTHIIRNLYPDPSVVFDQIIEVKEIVECAKDITKHYDAFIEISNWYRLLGEGTHVINGVEKIVSLYEAKRLLWLTIMSVNVLEGIRFYASFACTWAFGESARLLSSAQIVKLIARDENIHLAGTQMLLKTLLEDDPVFKTIAAETRQESIDLFKKAIEQEKDWARYLFKDGSIIGLNEQLLCQYLDYIAYKRMVAVGLPPLTKATSDPLPWVKRWVQGHDVQSAPQELTKIEYVIGQTNQDVTEDTFKGFSL